MVIMVLWVIFALMTAAAIVAVRPAAWARPAGASGRQRPCRLRDQLKEIDRDRANGLIGDAEAEAARA